MAGFAHQSLTNSQLSTLPARQRAADHDGLLTRIAATVRLWRRRSKDRATLARFTERDLKDIGKSSADIYWEISTPFWRGGPPC
jgi:uncharacterized protein YjiS (DUF1127 family)